MHTLQTHIKNDLEYCNTQKCLNEKTLKAYRIDLQQFSEQLTIPDVTEITSSELETYYLVGIWYSSQPPFVRYQVSVMQGIRNVRK